MLITMKVISDVVFFCSASVLVSYFTAAKQSETMTVAEKNPTKHLKSWTVLLFVLLLSFVPLNTGRKKLFLLWKLRFLLRRHAIRAPNAARPVVKCCSVLTLPLNSVISQVLTHGNASHLVSSGRASTSAQCFLSHQLVTNATLFQSKASLLLHRLKKKIRWEIRFKIIPPLHVPDANFGNFPAPGSVFIRAGAIFLLSSLPDNLIYVE